MRPTDHLGEGPRQHPLSHNESDATLTRMAREVYRCARCGVRLEALTPASLREAALDHFLTQHGGVTEVSHPKGEAV